MSAARVLHVDDEPDIRDVVSLSLGLDPNLTVRSCSSGGDALMAAADWSPDLILLDVMMPAMDGPTTLARLRQSPTTACIPVVFMTARAQPRELEHFVSLGAEGVIPKPFDPMTLAAAVRNYIGGIAAGISARRASFLERTRENGRALTAQRPALSDPAKSRAALDAIGKIVHSIAGGAGIFGLAMLSSDAIELEAIVNARLADGEPLGEVERRMDALIERIARM